MRVISCDRLIEVSSHEATSILLIRFTVRIGMLLVRLAALQF